jgi:alkylation response protein AidB-like acyl-CoA dehydrogenase
LITTLLSAECIGVARWATDTASAYAKIREQFGRPIGQFQAIKHKCAGMIAETERATAAVWDSARALNEFLGGNADAAYEFAAAVAGTLAPVAAHGDVGFVGTALHFAGSFDRGDEFLRRSI